MNLENDSLMTLKGHFLIAMPGLRDPNFSSTVVCMCEHTPVGSIGLVINRVYPSLTVKDIFDELKIEASPDIASRPVHYGGPVHTDELFILHGPPLSWQASLTIIPGLAMTNTRDILESIAQKQGPQSFMITLGCSGWGPDQLESEIKENVWLRCPVTHDLLFAITLESKWEEAVRRMGIDPTLLMETAGHA